MIGGVLALAAGTAGSALGAHALARRLRTGEPWTDALVFLLARLALVSAAVIAAGWIGALDAVSLGLASLAALAGLVAAGEHRRLPRLRRPEVPAGLLALALVVLARLLLQVWFFSPHLGDAVAYHLPKVAEWVRAGAFTREMGLHPHVTFPAGFELIETWWVVFLRHDVLIEMAGVEFVVLGFVATAALAKRAGISGRGAFLAGLIFALSPGFHLSATSCLNDAPVAALVAATAALVAARAPLWAPATALGLGLGVKATYGFALPGLALLAWLGRREPPAPRPESPRAGRILAATALVLGATWYVRNILWFGNPFYPLGEPDVHNPVAVQFGPGLSSLLANLRNVGVRALDGAAPLGANVDHGAGWGAPAFAVGVPAFVWAMREDAGLRRLGVAFGLSLAGSLLFVQDDPWCLKYVFYVPVVLAVAAAWAVERFPGLRWIAGVALSFAFVGTTLPYDLPWKDARALASRPWADRTALDLLGGPRLGDAVGAFGGFSARSYLLYGPDFSRRVVYLRASTAEELLDRMNAEKLRDLYATRDAEADVHVIPPALGARRLAPAGGPFYRLQEGKDP